MKTSKYLTIYFLIVAVGFITTQPVFCMTDDGDTKAGDVCGDDAVMVNAADCGDDQKQVEDPEQFSFEIELARKKIRNYQQPNKSQRSIADGYKRQGGSLYFAPTFDPVINFVEIVEYLVEASSFSMHYENGDVRCRQRAISQAVTNTRDLHIDVANMKTKDGRSVLDIALGKIETVVKYEQNATQKKQRCDFLEKVVWVLLMCGAPIDKSCSLHKAAALGNAAVCKMFLKNPYACVNGNASSASANDIGKNGQTPLHYAARAEHDDIYQMLISEGAQTDIVDKDGKTPEMYRKSGCVVS